MEITKEATNRQANDEVTCVQVRYKWYQMKPLLKEHYSDQHFIVDLINRNCTCLHFQIYHYCYHLSHCTLLFEPHQETEDDYITNDDIDISHFRGIKSNEDNDNISQWKAIKVKHDSGSALLATVDLSSKPLSIGQKELHDVSHLMKYADEKALTDARDTLKGLVLQLQAAQTIAPFKLRSETKEYICNRGPNDTVVRPLLNRTSRKRKQPDLEISPLKRDLAVASHLRSASTSVVVTSRNRFKFTVAKSTKKRASFPTAIPHTSTKVSKRKKQVLSS